MNKKLRFGGSIKFIIINDWWFFKIQNNRKENENITQEAEDCINEEINY